MNEDFIPYELAVKLIEKGFPQRPDYFNYSSYYDWDGLRKVHSLSNASVWFDPKISRDNICFAPTISQVLKWLREEKKIFIEIQISSQGYWCCIHENVRCEGNKDFRWDNWLKENVINEKKTYELAALAGIEYVIYNLI